MLQIASHGADSATSAPHQALPDEVSTSQAAAAAAQNSNGLFEVCLVLPADAELYVT